MILKARIILTIFCAAGGMELLISRVNLSLAIVKMAQVVSLETEQAEYRNPTVPFCYGKNGSGEEIAQIGKLRRNLTMGNEINVTKKITDYPLKITSFQRGMILSAFFYLYGLSCAFGGHFVDKFGAKKIFLFIVLVDSISNLFVPLAAKTHYGLLIFIRNIMGICQGAGFPCFYYLASLWIPEGEMSRFLSFVIPANSFGPILILNVGAVIISDLGWEYVFYLSGLMGLIFVVLWTFLIYDSPEEHPYISEREKKYILAKRKRTQKQYKKLPYKSMAKNLPLWANIVAHCGNMGGFTIILTQLPIYLHSIFGIDLKMNGFLSSVPYLARYMSANVVSWISVYLINKSKWTIKTWHRIITAVGFWSNGLCILLVGYASCNAGAAFSLLIMAMAFKGFTPSGYQSNLLKISPLFPGTSFGVLNLFAFSYGFLGPIMVGALTPQQTMDEWLKVFWIVFINYFLSGLFFIIFVSTEAQPWNYETGIKLSNDVELMKTKDKIAESESVLDQKSDSHSDSESRLKSELNPPKEKSVLILDK